MKPLYSYALIAAFAAIGQASAVEATTTPVGYSSQTLVQGFNLAGITLQTPTVAAGAVDLVGIGDEPNIVPDTQASFAPIAGKTYILEITSGTLAGSIQVVPAANITATSIRTPDDLNASGLANGDTYKLRLAPTLEEVFTTNDVSNGGVLTSSFGEGSADKVWVPVAAGVYKRYFLSAFGSFVSADTLQTAPNIPLVYADGLLIEKVSSSTAKLTVSGEVKTAGTNSVVEVGYNVVNIVAPVGLTLLNSGLSNSLTASFSEGSSDIVWVQQPNLTYKRYFPFIGFPNPTWRDVANPSVDITAGTDPALSSAILIEKKGTPTTLKLSVPSAYNTL